MLRNKKYEKSPKRESLVFFVKHGFLGTRKDKKNRVLFCQNLMLKIEKNERCKHVLWQSSLRLILTEKNYKCPIFVGIFSRFHLFW